VTPRVAETCPDASYVTKQQKCGDRLLRHVQPTGSPGGREFAAEFEQACQQRGWHLFVLPPRSPKLNCAVERAQRTHTQEFHQVMYCSLEMAALNRKLRK
jgi:hypothetical protein